MMTAATYAERRIRLQTYFDATAVKAWAQLTSDAPVSRIRETVRQGRDRMRATILSWLPTDMTGQALLDAGCGTGALAVQAAQRRARVTAIDVAGNLVALAQERAPAECKGAIDFQVGDMLNPALGSFDHVVAMDSLIHYAQRQIVSVLGELAARTRGSIIFTFAPQTPMLSAMHGVGLLFPRSDRAPAIEPVSEARLRKAIAADPALKTWRVERTQRITSGFYTSQALQLVRVWS
jgi:magnesium-protoporphyrin O-methyltransferase